MKVFNPAIRGRRVLITHDMGRKDEPHYAGNDIHRPQLRCLKSRLALTRVHLKSIAVMKTKHSTIAPTPQDLLEELRTLVADAEQMVSRGVTEKYDDTISALRSRFEAAQERFTNLYSSVRRKVVTGAKSTDRVIHAHPYQSLAITLGAGLIAGLLLARRSD